MLLWRGWERPSGDTVSILRLVEEDADALRSRYLAWVHDLGEARVGGGTLAERLRIRKGLSFWWLTLLAEKCNFSKSPQIDDAIKLMAFDRWVRHRPVGAIRLVSANRDLADCLHIWCADSDVRFAWQAEETRRRLPWQKRLAAALPPWVLAWAWLVQHAIRRRPLVGAGVAEWRNTAARATFVTYSDNIVRNARTQGAYESLYWATLPDALASDGCRTNWLHIYVPDGLLPDAAAAARAVRDFNATERGKRIHATPDSFMTARVLVRTLRDWAVVRYRSRNAERPLAGVHSEGLALWPLFRRDWRESISGRSAIGNLLYLNLFEAAMGALPAQDVGVYLQEDQGWEFALIHAWRAMGRHGRLVGCPHSTVRYWDLRYYLDRRSYARRGEAAVPLPDTVAVNGPAALHACVSGGWPTAMLYAVEALRYLYLAGLERPPRRTAELARRTTILVLGDYVDRNNRLQLGLLESAAPLLPTGACVIVKPHPNCPIRREDYPALAMEISSEPLTALLPACDVAYASAVTSAALDAYCAGIPVVSVADPEALDLSPLRGLAGVSFVRSAEDLARAVASAAPGIDPSDVGLFELDPSLRRWKRLLMCSGRRLP